METIASGLEWKERLMTHMAALCKGIGPRPPASPQERQAADYVKQTLRQLGYADVQEQAFHAPTTMAGSVLPALLSAFLALPLAWLGGPWGKALGLLLLLGCAVIMYQYLLGKQPFYHPWVARGTSQNIICNIPAASPTQQTIYLIGHLDTQKERFLSPPPDVRLFLVNSTVLILVPALAGLMLFVDLLLNRPGADWWEWIPFGMLLSFWLVFAWEESHPHVEGANDNATAVSVLLAVAEDLRAHPLQRSNVQLLFTGCEEVLCVGMEHYLRTCHPPLENTYWIDLEMVGTGSLCYVTQHGVGYLTRYHPHPEMLHLAARAAQRYPELGFIGKPMIIVEEVANLHARGYRAICLAGYNEKGHLPNWHRRSDNLEHIEPDTLCRAGIFTRSLLHEIDVLPGGN